PPRGRWVGRAAAAGGEFPRGRETDLPRQTDEGEEADDVVGDVDLPPPQAVTGGRREGVVVVVPTLAHRQHPDDRVVPALVPAVVRPGAPQVADRVHAPGDVVPEED